jgi:GAF domain-containing protein
MPDDEEPTGCGSGRGGIAAYRRLRDVAGRLLALRELDPLLEGFDALIQELLHVDACSIAMLDERSRTLVPLLTRAGGRTTPLEPLPLELFDGRIGEAIAGGRTIAIAGGLILDGGEPSALAEPESALTAMLTPLLVVAPHRGVLWVGRIHGAAFTPDDRQLAEAIAALLALGLRNVYDSTDRTGHKDPHGAGSRGAA